MSQRILPVILAGGSGSRLWPLSRENYPKQLLPLVSNRSLLQESIIRTQKIPDALPPLVICNKSYRFIIAEQMLEVGIEEPKLLLEPLGRNTAPAIALAAHLAQQLYPGANIILLVLPADHLINEVHLFADAVINSINLASQGQLVTFGIKPDYPETGYGYIKAGNEINTSSYQIEKFVEKPDRKTAEEYCESGQYYWNSGMFLFAAQSYLVELAVYRPDIASATANEAKQLTELNGFFSINDSFSKCPADSIDYAVMENTKNGVIVPLQVKWNDMGSWSAFWDVIPPDENGNIIQGDITHVNTKNCYLRAESRLIATAGVQDHIIVETADAVMVAHRDYAQNVKDLFLKLKSNKRLEAEVHTLIHEEWGTIEIIAKTDAYCLQHIILKPGHSVSRERMPHTGYCLIISGEVTCSINHVTSKLIKGDEKRILPNAEYSLSNQETSAVSLFLIELK